ncbi:hypothetical protein H2198_004019 [Neophaeococcomyces mojaviensis]|uniref:Uncharacterized protein n=1 Tax=Neophaeococcomyces mojaviensis TaxID=3383035 RepID=A0ACC3AA72_9EURO|nr:hypothetical protein H2198_004019 [Knufia sp. JES_112]
MHILGIANGTPNGNSEVLLKAALSAAVEYNSSTTVSWIHAPSVSIPRNPKPLEGTQDVSQGANEAFVSGKPTENVPDDRRAILNAILDADALIFATPVYSHAPAGFLKAMVDRILGPFTDVVFATMMLKAKEAGDPRYKDATVDPRLIKPRVVGFLAIGGSTTPDQFTLALPTLHLMVYPLHAKVVDQVVIMGCGSPGLAAIKDGGAVVERAQLLGRNVASQMGKSYDEAQYLGAAPPGACPYCHLAKIELFDIATGAIGCNTCGALGKLIVGEDGALRPMWDMDCTVSSLTWKGKERHIEDLKTIGAKEMKDIRADEDFEGKRQRWKDVEVKLVELPSQQPGTNNTIRVLKL